MSQLLGTTDPDLAHCLALIKTETICRSWWRSYPVRRIFTKENTMSNRCHFKILTVQVEYSVHDGIVQVVDNLVVVEVTQMEVGVSQGLGLAREVDPQLDKLRVSDGSISWDIVVTLYTCFYRVSWLKCLF